MKVNNMQEDRNTAVPLEFFILDNLPFLHSDLILPGVILALEASLK